MTEAAPAGGWRTATVREIAHPTPRGVALRLEVPDRVNHWPGQHYVVRLTAEDGYTAQRSYSLASAPSDPLIELFVERLEDGEVSTYLADVVEPGDELDIRGPIGGWFVWTGGAPALAVAGGSGVVPIVSMLRHAVDLGTGDLRVAVSSRTLSELPYREELAATGARIVTTREPGPDGRSAGRLSRLDVEPLIVAGGTSYVCGSTGFAETASQLLIAAGVPSEQIRVERFGPSG